MALCFFWATCGVTPKPRSSSTKAAALRPPSLGGAPLNRRSRLALKVEWFHTVSRGSCRRTSDTAGCVRCAAPVGARNESKTTSGSGWRAASASGRSRDAHDANIAPGNRLHIGQDGVDQRPYRPGTAEMVLTSERNQLNVIANLYININRIERNEEMAKFIKNLALKIPLSSSL